MIYERCWHHDWYRVILRQSPEALEWAAMLQKIMDWLVVEDNLIAKEKRIHLLQKHLLVEEESK